MENYSLSDIAAATGSEGFGGNTWLILLFILIFGMGGNGFGFNRGDGASSEVKFDALQTSINKVGDGLASLGYSQLQQMTNDTASINGNVVNEGRAIQTQLCSIKESVHAEGEATRAMLQQNKIETLQNQLNTVQNQLALSNAMCGVPKTNPYLYGITPNCACNNV